MMLIYLVLGFVGYLIVGASVLVWLNERSAGQLRVWMDDAPPPFPGWLRSFVVLLWPITLGVALWAMTRTEETS